MLFDTILGNIYLRMDMKTKRLQLSAQPGVSSNAIPLRVPLCNAAGIDWGITTGTEGVVAPHSAATVSLPLIKNNCQGPQGNLCKSLSEFDPLGQTNYATEA